MGTTHDTGSQTTASRLARRFTEIRKATGRGAPGAASAQRMTDLIKGLIRPANQSRGYSNVERDHLIVWCGYADGSGLCVELSTDELGVYAGDRDEMRDAAADDAKDASLTEGDARDLIRSVPLEIAKKIRVLDGMDI